MSGLRVLVAVRSIAARRASIRPSSPAELARRLDPTFRVTPTIRLLSDAAVRSITKPDQRNIVTTPPRTGKSQLMAVWTPVWALMREPDLQIVVVAYADELAQEHSRKARRIIQDHHEFLGYRLSPDKTAVGRWTVEGRKGGMLATGIQSGVTGFGADCVSGDTRIVTEYGNVSAEVAYREEHSQVWSYDHATGVAGWHRVQARRRIDGRAVVEVRTVGGRVLRCTSDHRVYTRRGYVAAGSLGDGDAILAADCSGGVSSLRGGVLRVRSGAAEVGVVGPVGDLLFDELPVEGFGGSEAVEVLSGVFGAGRHSAQEGDLFGRVFGSDSAWLAQVSGEAVSAVRRFVSAEVGAEGVLHAGLCGRGAFGADGWSGEFAFQDGDELRELVSVDAAVGVGAGWPGVRGVRGVSGAAGVRELGEECHKVAFDHSSHQRGSDGQSCGESDHDVRDVSRGASQVDFDAVSSVEEVGGGPVSVYDFQVEGARNFFADGLLVHNCLIIDDPVKDQSEADSKAHRERVIKEFRSTLVTRLHKDAGVCLSQTRWHEKDLAGELLSAEPDRWHHINVPAISAVGVPDSLNRPPGVAMVSALGFSAEHFVGMRRSVGERVWNALFQGVPRAPEGGLVKLGWLDSWRLPVAPYSPVRVVVGVDPSDSGSGDSCGIVAASLGSDGVVAVVADVSAPMTSDEWAREAVALAVAVGASEIAVEGFAARETYMRVVREALARARVGRPVAVSSWPPKGRSRVGDSVARSASLLQGLEVGTVRIAGHLPGLEASAVGWQLGQHQPDCLAALVVAHDVLVSGAGRGMGFSGVPGGGGSVVGLDWLSRRLAG